VIGLDRAAYRLRVQVELVRDGADLPVFSKEEAANFGNLFGRDHGSLQVIKRIDKKPQAPADRTDDA